jgi:hypothetical protein
VNDLERLVATDQIRQLASRYALALDMRDLDALVALFVDDVRVGSERGRAALRARFDAQLRGIGVSILFVGNHVIDFAGLDGFEEGEHARGVVYCRGEIQEGERWIHQAIQYRDEYARRGGRWLFVRRVHLLWYGVAFEPGDPANPLALAPADWPAHHTGLGTLPASEESWRRFWSNFSAKEPKE